MLAQDARGDVGDRLSGGQAGTAGHRELHSDTGSRCADDHDLVGILGGRYLAVEHVVERVHGEGRPAIAPLVELRQHQCALIRLHAQATDLHRFADIELDVAGAQVQALDRGQQGHRRNRITVIVHQQRLQAHRAIDILYLVEVGDTGSRVANRVDGHLAADGRDRKPVLRRDRALEHEIGQRLVRIPLWLAQHKHRRHQHVAGVAHAGGQHGIGIERLLGLGDHPGQRTSGRIRVGRQQRLHLADEAQSAVHLRLDEENSFDDGLGLRGRQLVDQLGVDVTRPGPAADIGDALIVDRDDGNTIGRKPGGAGTGEIVEAALQRADQVGDLVEQQDSDNHRHSCKPIRAPELSIFRR